MSPENSLCKRKKEKGIDVTRNDKCKERVHLLIKDVHFKCQIITTSHIDLPFLDKSSMRVCLRLCLSWRKFIMVISVLLSSAEFSCNEMSSKRKILYNRLAIIKTQQVRPKEENKSNSLTSNNGKGGPIVCSGLAMITSSTKENQNGQRSFETPFFKERNGKMPLLLFMFNLLGKSHIVDYLYCHSPQHEQELPCTFDSLWKKEKKFNQIIILWKEWMVLRWETGIDAYLICSYTFKYVYTLQCKIFKLTF